MISFKSACLCTASVFALTTASVAQTAPADGPIEQVVVSGTRISIAGYEQPTPVTVVGAAQLKSDAYPQIQDALSTLPQITSPPASYSNVNGTGGGGNANQNTINLRNLGKERTLVLFDGQRMTITGISGSVDTTTIPSAMISRIDVVTAGASAAWGSDAVGGVANFIVNKNFQGFSATAQASTTSDGLYRTFFTEAAWGDDIFGGRGHIEFAGNMVVKPDTVLLTQENWFKGAFFVSNPAYVAGNGKPQLIMATNVGLANLTAGGIINASPAGSGATPAAANALRGIQFVGNGIPQIVNYGNLTSNALSNGGSLTMNDTSAPLSPVALRGNVYTTFGYGSYKLTDTISASLQLNYSYITGLSSSSPNNQPALVIKSDNAFIPASVRATMQAGGIASFTLGTETINNYDTRNATGERFSQQSAGNLGVVYAQNRRKLIRGVFTLDGSLGNDWSWNAYAQHSEVFFWSTVRGVEINANLAAAQDAVVVTTANRGASGLPLGSIVCRSSLPGQAAVVTGSGSSAFTAQPGCIPLNVFGEGVASPAAIAYVTGAATNSLDRPHTHNGQDNFEASVQGTLPWELPAGKIAAVLGAGYRKEFGWQDGGPIGNLNGYSNGNFPPVARGTHYNVMEGFAEIDAPILKDNIVNSLSVSAAGRITDYSTSGTVETWKLGVTSQIIDDIKIRVTGSVDIRAPQLRELYAATSLGFGTAVDPRTQLGVSIVTATSGNPNLRPEVAHTISGGFVLTPTFIDGLSFSADWYAINVKDVISGVSSNQILAACNPTLPSPTRPGQNGTLSDPLCANLVFGGAGGALSQVNVFVVNAASTVVSGMDLQFNYVHDFLDGTLSWSSNTNFMNEHVTTAPGLTPNNIAGSNDVAAGTPGGLTPPGSKWKGTVAATYAAGPYSFTVQSRWFGTSVSHQDGNTGSRATAATRNLYDPAHFNVPAVAYLELRGNYKWNDNISVFGAIDNVLNTPPPLVLPTVTGTTGGGVGFYNTNQNIYDMLGRAIRAGVRFNY